MCKILQWGGAINYSSGIKHCLQTVYTYVYFLTKNWNELRSYYVMVLGCFTTYTVEEYENVST